MKDMLGNTLNVGDSVLFASKAQGECELYKGVVTGFAKKYGQDKVTIKKNGGSSNARTSAEVLNIGLFEEGSPELFLN